MNRYNTPSPGATDWHQPLNNNFEQLNIDVEIRDTEESLNDYTPKDGAMFRATDTGTVYLGNGSDWSRAALSVDSVRSNSLNSIYQITEGHDEGDVRAVLDEAGYGDAIVINPAATPIDVTNGSIDIPSGVGVFGYEKESNSSEGTFRKQFDGDLMTYGDWNTLKNIHLNANASNGYTGDALTPRSTNNRECYFESCSFVDAEAAGFRMNATYLSTFIGCKFASSQDGVVNEGDGHSPHNVWLRCRMAYNSRAGIDIRKTLDKEKFLGCLIDLNGVGIDTERKDSGRAITSSTVFGSGTYIHSNDGPGIVLRGGADAISINLEAGSRITGNNENPSGSLTNTNGQGDIHSENGGRIEGNIVGHSGHIRRYNSDGVSGDMTISGFAKDIELPDTYLIVLNDRNVGDISCRSGFGLDPRRGGGTISY